jgi:acetyltransferase-like isoleucine patch superfamily enzyme
VSYYSDDELRALGIAQFGQRVRISRKTSLYGCERMRFGNDVRIDDFAVLSAGEGGIELGSYVHVAVFSLLIGKGRITMEDFSGLSSRVSIYSSSDDYTGKWMTNPTVPDEFTGAKHADVRLGRHVIIGANSVILPGTVLEEGAAVGALSLVHGRCQAFTTYSGVPARKIATRQKRLLELEQALLQQRGSGAA